VPAVSSSPALAAWDYLQALPADLSADLSGVQPGAVTSLADALGAVPDPRRARGVRHQALAMMVIAACATLSGARSYAAISEWAAHLGRHVLAALDGGGGDGKVPCESTLRRLLQVLDVAALEAALSWWVCVARQTFWQGPLHAGLTCEGV
jgi:hypothetical protein